MTARHVVVVGGINADLKARTTAPLVPGTSNPGTATLSPGGVGRNIAENLAHLGTPVSLVGVVGFANSSIYCASKFALEGWSESLAQEVAPLGIRATLIEPGMFRTGFMGQDSTRMGDLVIDDYADTVAKHRAMVAAYDGKQPGDPAKLARWC